MPETRQMTDILRDKLQAAFQPASLEVINESHLHAGHSGSPGTGESHFRVVIVAEAFEGLSLVARQRAVNAALKEELAGKIHALAMKTHTPAEAAA